MPKPHLRCFATTLLACFLLGILSPICAFAETDSSLPESSLNSFALPQITHPADKAVVSGKLEVRINVKSFDGGNVVLLLDGRLRAISNVEPFIFTLNTDKMSEGAHSLQAQVHLPDGTTLHSAVSTILVGGVLPSVKQPLPRRVVLPSTSKISQSAVALSPQGKELPLSVQADLTRPSRENISLLQPVRIARTIDSPAKWEMDLTSSPTRQPEVVAAPQSVVPKTAPIMSQAKQYCRLPNSLQQSLYRGWVPRPEEQSLSLSLPKSEKTTEAVSPVSLDTIVETPPPPAEVKVVETQKPKDSELCLHEVKKGESLWSIARQYGCSVEAVAAANAIQDMHKIRIGDKLWIPADPALYVEGKPLLTTPGPFFHQGKLMVPLRATVEACNGTVHWDSATRQVQFNFSGSKVVIPVGQSLAYRDDHSISLKSEVMIRDNRSFVALDSLQRIAALPIRYEQEQNRIEIARLSR